MKPPAWVVQWVERHRPPPPLARVADQQPMAQRPEQRDPLEDALGGFNLTQACAQLRGAYRDLARERRYNAEWKVKSVQDQARITALEELSIELQLNVRTLNSEKAFGIRRAISDPLSRRMS